MLYADVHLGRYIEHYEMGVLKCYDFDKLPKYLDKLSILNTIAESEHVDQIINLGDTFDILDLSGYEGGEYYRKWLERNSSLLGIYEKNITKIKSVFKNHVMIRGNNDPRNLPKHWGINLVISPAEFLNDYLLLSFSKYESDRPDLSMYTRKYKACFAHWYNGLVSQVDTDKIFFGHFHERQFPKTRVGKRYIVGAFSDSSTYPGFIIYNDSDNTITEYDLNGRRKNLVRCLR